jgi:hypothetical protein
VSRCHSQPASQNRCTGAVADGGADVDMLKPKDSEPAQYRRCTARSQAVFPLLERIRVPILVKTWGDVDERYIATGL